MNINGTLWLAMSTLVFSVGQVAAAEPWQAVEQPELKEVLERAPVLQTESLGEPARGVNVWERWLVPNPDGKSWDVLQIYFKEYYGPTWLYAIDLGTGQVKKQRLADGHQFYLSGRALGFDGKYYIACPSRKTWSMDLFVYDPATNTVEERGEIVPGLGGEVRPLVTGPDGRIYGTGTRDNKVGLYIYDPKLGKVVKDFGSVGPAHPNGAWSRYVMGVDDTHAYIASGMIPAWYLVAVNLATGEENVLLESPTERVMDIIESFPSAYARVPQDGGAPDKEYWLYHGQAIPKTNDTPPWPKQASPWDKATPKPDVYFDQIDPDSEGHATLWYRSGEDEGWKPIRLEGVPSYPHRINPMSILPDGRLYGTGDDYAGVFVFDPPNDQTTILGPRPGLAPYTQIVCDGKLYSSGYSGGHLFVYDPSRPWTLSKGGPPGHSAPDQADAKSNARYLGDFDRTTRVGLMHSSALGADGRIYFGGFGLRHYTGGGFGWYDPKTQKMDGFWKPLSGYAVQWIASALDGKLIVISTIRAADELNDNRAPEEAKLFVYDVSERKIIREIVPMAKGRTTGLITEVRSGRLFGLTSDPEQSGRSILYGVDATTGEVLFTKALPSPVSVDDHWPHWVDPSYEYNAFVRGPDGFVWTYLKDVLVRIDPKDASVHAVGKIDPVGWPTFVGNDVYFSGPEQLRRIRNIVPPADSAAGQHAAKVAAFQFGTPTSAVRAGFTKVTTQDAFTVERGYGFQSTQGLEAFDRGGSEIVSPDDQYTASTYGAFRTTSDLTCALIEGADDNAFQVSLPDGQYTVWLVASDAEWDPPLFEVWANGRKKLDVRTPRARFVFMESFQARATDGRLQIELKGPHGWVLNGLVIGHEGSELADVVAKLERDIFFLTEPELPNWHEVKSEPANPSLDWSTSEQEKGYVVSPVDYTEQIVPTYVPARAAVGKPVTTFATPGEFEPATFCISSWKDLGRVVPELSDFLAEKSKQTIARENVKVGIVRCRPARVSGWGGKGEYHIAPETIESPDGRASYVSAGQTKQWWLTVHVPPDAAPGRYKMSLTVRAEKAPPTILEWRLLVLPFRLSRPADKHWGTWLESFPPVGGLRGPERRGRNTPAETERLVRADLADYRDHGFDLAIFNYYFGVKENLDGSFTYDISGLARDLDYWKTLGANTPVAIGMEYTCRNLEYGLAEPGKEHVPGTFSPKARLAIIGLVRHIHDEAQRRGWPQIYFYPIDEPGNNKTANRMLFAENVLGFVHEVPGCQTATTLTAGDVQRLGDRVDVRIYAYGHYNRNKVVREARQGHPFWYYENGLFYGHSTLASRGNTGFEFLRSGAEVATAWGFDATQANPDNDFDGGHKDWNVIFPGVDGPTPTIYWELCREGVDDCRYVATLQQQIRQAAAQGKAEAADRAQRVLSPLLDPNAPPIDNPLAFARYRWRMAREILNLMGDRDLALSFPPVVTNPAASDQMGPNVIGDPSFEAGPQTDGFPVPSYHIADQYSKSDEKPVEALSVTDEVAHSGRYSLKWDFSKAAGKGSIYDGKRYLIVNVQVPQEAARQLRGKRVKVGYWFRLGGGPAVPGMTLRQFGKGEFLDGISYQGGVDDPSVWNHFEAQGRLRNDVEGLDLHISCPMPDDPEAAGKSLFYIDDVSLQGVDEPPLAIATPLDEHYVGETIPWTVSAASASAEIKITLLIGDTPVAEQTQKAKAGSLRGIFESRGLKCGIYTLQASADMPPQGPQTARRQIILAPDPWEEK